MAEARGVVAETVPRFAALLRNAPDPRASAVGEWNVAEVGAHLSHVCAGEMMSAASAGAGPGPAVGVPRLDGIARFNAENLGGDPERDPRVLALRIEERVAELLESTSHLRGDETVTWLGGTQFPVALIFCHLLGELLVHGYDVARASQLAWEIPPRHAAFSVGFLFSFLQTIDPTQRSSFVDPNVARGLRACYEIRLRRARNWYLEFDDGSLSIPLAPTRPIDCHISADPVAFLLVGFGRIGPIRPALAGRMIGWGRRPHLALKLPRLLKSP
jgi:uncharacterized protein (TIGR03083 family)